MPARRGNVHLLASVSRALLLVSLVSAPRAAGAFLSPREYDAASWVGGGDGRAFTGSPRWRGYGCQVCHVPAWSPPLVVVESDPPELFTRRTYTPGARYVVTVSLLEILPPSGPIDPLVPQGNGLGADFVGAAGEPAGTISPCLEGITCRGPEDITDSCDPDLCDEGEFASTPVLQRVGDLGAVVSPAAEIDEWSFAWTAPDEGAGDVALHIAVVDGNSDRDMTGDAMAISKIELAEGGGGASASAFIVGLAPALVRFRRRR